jgi:phage terminase small subunit
MTEVELAPKTAAVFAALAEDAPIREADALPNADTAVVRMLAEALVRIDRIADFLDRRGWQDEKGEPRPVLDYERRLRDHALDLMRELGMTPASRLKLGVDLVRAHVAAQGAEVDRAARERAARRFAIDVDPEGEA